MGGAKLVWAWLGDATGRSAVNLREFLSFSPPTSSLRLPAGPGPCSRWSPRLNMELRMILPAFLCVSAACLQSAGAAAPRRGPKVTEKVGADAAACVNPTLRYFSVLFVRYIHIRGDCKRCGCLFWKTVPQEIYAPIFPEHARPALPLPHARSAALVAILMKQRVRSRQFTHRCAHTKGIPFMAIMKTAAG